MKRVFKIIGISIIAIIVAFIALVVIIAVTSDPVEVDPERVAAFAAEREAERRAVALERQVQFIYDAASGMTLEQAHGIVALLEDVGVGRIISARNDFDDTDSTILLLIHDEATYEFNSGGNELPNNGRYINVAVDRSTMKARSIFFRHGRIYFEGIHYATIPDFYLDRSQRDNIAVSVKLNVDNFLTFPLTARYDATQLWRFQRNMYDLLVTGRVTAENAFGVRSEFFFEVTIDLYAWAVTDVILR